MATRTGSIGGLNELARDPRYAAYEPSDNTFQRSARLLQSMWRDEHNLPMGYREDAGGKRIPMGSRLDKDYARHTLANFLTEEIRGVVRETLASKTDQLIEEERLYANLLSSQPLCFNLFAPLKRDVNLATAVLRDISGISDLQVEQIEFEYSPGRGAPQFSGDRSAFDVCAFGTTERYRRFLIAIEVKYHENMRCTRREDHSQHIAISKAMGCFDESAFETLARSPIEQIWRDHVLAGSARPDPCDGFLSVVLYPGRNTQCDRAVAAYRRCLTNHDTFTAWRLEDFHAALARHRQGSWVADLYDRYLNFAKLSQ